MIPASKAADLLFDPRGWNEVSSGPKKFPSEPIMDIKTFIDLGKKTFAAWNEDKVPRLGAALSYYTVFSISPMLVVAIGVASIFLGDNAAREELYKQISGTVGSDAAGLISQMLQNSSQGGQGRSLVATIIGFATILLGAGGLFGQLQDSLNTIWGVQPKPNQGFWFMLRTRFISFAMVLGIGFMLLVSLVASTAIAALSNWMKGSALPGPDWLFEVLNLVISIVVFTGLFAAIYKVLPDVEIQWRDVWIGAFVTSILFSAGKLALGWYLGRQSVESTYGAASSLVILLLWVYYASQITFFGAEFTKVYADNCGSQIVPSEHAEAVSDEAKARQGMPNAVGKNGGGQGNPASPAPRPLVVASEAPEERIGSPAFEAKQRKMAFEHNLAVVAGAAMAVLWVVRRTRRHA